MPLLESIDASCQLVEQVVIRWGIVTSLFSISWGLCGWWNKCTSIWKIISSHIPECTDNKFWNGHYIRTKLITLPPYMKKLCITERERAMPKVDEDFIQRITNEVSTILHLMKMASELFFISVCRNGISTRCLENGTWSKSKGQLEIWKIVLECWWTMQRSGWSSMYTTIQLCAWITEWNKEMQSGQNQQIHRQCCGLCLESRSTSYINTTHIQL